MAAYTYQTLSGADGRAMVMDPYLMRAIAYKQSGRTKAPTATTGENEVAVVARVTSVDAWRGMSEVFAGTEIPVMKDNAPTNEWIVTGRVPISRIEHVRAQEFVRSLKAARRLHPGLSSGTNETLAQPAQLPVGNRTNAGKGAIVGIVDLGCDFAHRNFIDSANHTRLRLLWDQGAPTSGSGVPFGRLMTAAEINVALPKANPYQALDYSPGPTAHGTHVMDIAAGNGAGSGVKGCAPGAELLFVHIASSDIPWSGAETVGKSFGDSVQLLEALQFIFARAADKPCVINVSLGTNGGPHDGTTLVEQGIDSLIRQQPNRAVVIAASNSFADGIHATASVPANGHFDLQWRIGPQDVTDNELEIWYPNAGRLELELLDPTGESLGRIPVNESGTVNGSDGNIVVFAANRLDDPNNHDNNIGVFLSPDALSGTWTVRLHNTRAEAVSFHGWIERDDDGQSTFTQPLDNSHTLGSISCGRETIVVGSYDAHQPNQPVSFFTSAGPTRDGRQKPEVSAPGHNVLAARSLTGTATTRMSGTSMAAPMVTGIVALVLAEAHARNRNLTHTQIRDIVRTTARKTPPATNPAWDPRYGFGRISARAAVEAVMQPPVAPAADIKLGPTGGGRGAATAAVRSDKKVTHIATARRARAAHTPTSPKPKRHGKKGRARRAASGR